MSERGRAVLAAHGPTGLCQYYASGALYRLVEQVLGLVNTLRYRWAASDPIEVHLFTGHSFRLPSGDAGIGIELMSGIREPNATRYLASFLRNDDVILDIGANIGYYVAVERHLAPGAAIHAVEPVPANLALLRQNAPPDVAVYLCGVEGAEREGSPRKGGGGSGAPSSLSPCAAHLNAGGGST